VKFTDVRGVDDDERVLADAARALARDVAGDFPFDGGIRGRATEAEGPPPRKVRIRGPPVFS
jgi:hypothetical protein